MEININTSKYANLNLHQRTELYNSAGITLEHFRWVYDLKRDVLSDRGKKAFMTNCPKLTSVTGVLPSDVQLEILHGSFSLLSAQAISNLSDRKSIVSTENLISTLLMANQIGKVEIDFEGGIAPSYTITAKGDDEESDVVLGVVRINSGVPVYNLKVCKVIKDFGIKTCPPATSLAVSTGVVVAACFKFGVDKVAYPHPYIPHSVKVPGTAKSQLVTGFAAVAQDAFKHAPASCLQVVADIAKKSSLVAKIFEIHPKKLGITPQEVKASPLFSGRAFKDLPAPVLRQYHQQGYDALGRARDILKNADTGFAAMNAPMKWRIPIEVITGCPDAENFERTQSISYFGAAGARARRLFERRGFVTAYDLKSSPKPTKKIKIEDFERFKIYQWNVSDIFQQEEIEGDIFVSDIYIDAWRELGPDLGGHKFVAGILRGQIMNNDHLTCDSIPPLRMVKGFLPTEDDYDTYSTSYPFWGFRTCRPMTTEVIYLSAKNDYDQESIAMNLQIWFDSGLVDDRIRFIRSREDHEKFVKTCLVAICEELNFQQRKLSLDPRDSMGSFGARKWTLSSADLPCLFVPKHMRANAINAIDSNSAFFGANILGEVWGDDDVAALAAELAPGMDIAGDPDEGGVVGGDPPDHHAGGGIVVNFDDDEIVVDE